MNDAPVTHPGREQLVAFGLGQLSPQDRAAVERHVAECSVCCAFLESLPPDSLVHLVQASMLATCKGEPPAETHRGAAAATQIEASAQASPVLPLDPPTDLAGHPRYRLLRVLGQGGMGAVYQAEHRVMERLVALKVIRKALIEDPKSIERFRREVKAAAKLAHPNIVTAHDAEEAGDTQFLVMEFVEGVSLAQLVDTHGPLSVSAACQYVRQAALGLQHAHEAGMVHRDLKPQNLMLTTRGIVKILDFGLARFVSEASNAADGLTADNMMMGTPDYIAPEQALDSRSADIRADIYSLGCTLYYLLAGQPPFPGGTTMQKVTAHMHQQPAGLGKLAPGVPVELEQVVARMMAKDPAARFRTPGEVALALEPFLNSQVPAAPVPTQGMFSASTIPPSSSMQPVFEQATLVPVAASEQGSPFWSGARSLAVLLALLVLLPASAWLGWSLLGRGERDRGSLELTAGKQEGEIAPRDKQAPEAAEEKKPAKPPPDTPRPSVEGLRIEVRDDAIAWVRRNNKFGPQSGVVDAVGRKINTCYEGKDCFIETIGGKLLKSGRTTVLAGRGDGFFVFELSGDQAGITRCPPGADGIVARLDLDRRATPPVVVLSNPTVNLADRITGAVQYRVNGRPPAHLALRLVYYLESANRWLSASQPLGTLENEGKLAISAASSPVSGRDYLVVFLELIEESEGHVLVVSNSVACLVAILPK